MLLQLPIRSAPSVKPFRFLNLPSEIRNTIYELVMCDIQDPKIPSSYDRSEDFAMNKHSIQPQLLRTCRQIHDEAKNVMLLGTNLFIEDQIIAEEELHTVYDFLQMLIIFRVPLFRLQRNQKAASRDGVRGNFNGCVMRHHISTIGQRSSRKQRVYSMMILHRHLKQFSAAIMQAEWFMLQRDQGTRHEVILLNPLVPASAELAFSKRHEATRVLSLETLKNLRGKLVPLMPLDLKQLDKLQIKNHTTEYPQDMISPKPTIRRPMTTEGIMKDLQQVMAVGDRYSQHGSFAYALSAYKLLGNKIFVWLYLCNEKQRGPFNEEGSQLESHIREMSLILCYVRTKIAVASMLEFEHDNREELQRLFNIVQEITDHVSKPMHWPRECSFRGYESDEFYRLCYKQDFGQVLSKTPGFLYLQAVAFRIMGKLGDVRTALEKVKLALTMLPNEPRIMAEKEKIERELQVISSSHET
ncbi:hypothetical protein DSL72_006800 [Monilinia vaccinii-corymbosi]|uniref:Uncharacterized protein n=1 Tax=Monilinia vaccinii-corymbosi TaxID=61207 RepID=A0A8A3PK31_9HELO|nr:hypothetical protein DSL72_006800 [Monilinia vaccinii-corymbosi]